MGYPETEKLLILCEILDVDLDYLLRDKSLKAQDNSTQKGISFSEFYIGKWVRIFLKDQEFKGFHCVAFVAMYNSFLIIMDDKGKLGLVDGDSVNTILDFANEKKIMKLPAIPDREAVKDICSYLVNRKCDVRLKQEGLKFKKPGGFYSVTVESISDDEIIVNDLDKRKQAARLSDILYIKEC